MLGLVCILTSCEDEEQPPSGNIETNFQKIIQLPPGIIESSGIIYLEDQYLWTHNDSGDGPVLYEVDLNGIGINRSVTIANAVNKDWEAITNDDTVVFVGDFGNNHGNRTDLVIYKISKTDLLSETIVSSSDIFFSYEDQIDFAISDKHNFDCEAMIPFNDQLYLFTKNRGNLQTNIYQLSRNPGTQVATLHDTFDTEGLITAAAISPDKNTICLLGYNIEEDNYNPFVWLLYDFSDTDFLGGKKVRVGLDMNKQTEAIYFKDDNTLYFTFEEEDEAPSYVYSFDVGEWME